MASTPQLDAFSGIIILVMLGFGALALFAVILLEAIVLRRLGWAALGRSFVDSLVMNLASALIGILVAWVLRIDFTQAQLTGMLIPLVVFSLALSILVEGGVISFVRRRHLREILRPLALANIASYAMIILWIIVSSIRKV
ncbi:MAG: hypothetical protein GTO14_06375 [Anaerolineales bacterium]|nr:hypothetical protein [Anaerolineales bacterium]